MLSEIADQTSRHTSECDTCRSAEPSRSKGERLRLAPLAVGQTGEAAEGREVLSAQGQAALYDAGHRRPVIDKTFPCEQTLEALADVEQGRATRKVVITLD